MKPLYTRDTSQRVVSRPTLTTYWEVARWLRLWENAAYRRSDEPNSMPWSGESDAARNEFGKRLLWVRRLVDDGRLLG